MYKNIKAMFADRLSDFVFTKDTAKDIAQYLSGIQTRNEQHVEFFASTLVGVHSIKFLPSDVNYLWDVILEADREETEGALHSLRSVDASWKVGGNVTNHALVWLMHKAQTSNLPENAKAKAVKDLLFIILFKFLTSLYYRDFPHPANKEIAMATYNKLSNRSLLKQVDSWYELFILRCSKIYEGAEDRKPFKQIIGDYDNDKTIVAVITGLETSLNRIMVRWNRVFYAVRDSGERFKSSSRMGQDAEGNSVFNDLSNISKYRLHLESRITQSKSFMNRELVEAIATVARKSPKDVEAVLKHISKHYQTNSKDAVTVFVNSSLTYGITKLIDADKDLKDVKAAYGYLNSIFISHKAVNLTLERARENGDKVVNKVLRGKGTEGIRTLVSIYIVLWTIITV